MMEIDSGEELLRNLLREKNVPSNSTWKRAIQLMEPDPRFNSVRSLPNRKFLFSEYKQNKEKEERDEQKLKAKKAREDLESFLCTDTRVNSSMKYRQACDEFGSMQVWKAVPDEEREEIFTDKMKEIREKEFEEANRLRESNRDYFRTILDSIPEITAQTTWADAQNYISQNESIQIPKMSKLDALEVFIDYIEQLELEESKERRRQRKEREKLERDNRFAFIGYLDELHAAGILTSISKWQNLYQVISADPRYVALLSQPLSGSTPLDLFKFYVEDLKARYEDEKQIIHRILEDRNFVVTMDTTFVDFASFVADDERSASLDGGNLKMIFERLSEKEREKERNRQREIQKERRKLEHGLYAILAKHLDADDIDSLDWQTVRPLICEEPAFKAIPKEEDRIEVFRNYLNLINETCLHHHKKLKN